MVVLSGYLWFLMVHLGSWWFLVVCGGSWCFLVVLADSSRFTKNYLEPKKLCFFGS